MSKTLEFINRLIMFLLGASLCCLGTVLLVETLYNNSVWVVIIVGLPISLVPMGLGLGAIRSSILD